jgi:hypothetical protein
MTIPSDANQHLELDLVSDTLADSWRFRALYVIDFSRECLASVAENAIFGEPVPRDLD